MQIQLQLYPNHTLTLTPPISSPPSRTFSDSKFVSNSRFNSGFSTSLKTVLKSRIRFRDFGPLSTDGFALFVQGKDVDNGLQVNNSSFNSMFFDSLKRVSKSKRSSDGLIGVKCAVSLKGNGGQVGLQRNGDDENDDRYYMRRCVELARKAIGCTSPNPMVGCVIVKEGKIVGEGFHPKAGQPHAEVFALRDAGDLAENATAYVSLEPCNHYGRTPPCTEALIKAKVKKVVVGMVDPNPIVASKGVDRLRDAGIEVIVGVEEESCKKLNEAYIHQMLTGKPFFTLRYSLSVNGQFLNQLGEGVYEQGGYYSKLFQEYDAVILSQSSIFEKHGGYFRVPALGEPGANHTARFFVADSKVSLWTNLESETGQEGVSMQNLGQISLNTILEQCKGRGLCSVLLDLRGNPSDFEELLEECLKENLLQKLVIEVLPLWEGSPEARFPAALEKHFGQRVSLKNLTSRLSEESVVLEGYFL